MTVFHTPKRDVFCDCRMGKRGKYRCTRCDGTGWISRLPEGQEQEVIVVRSPRNGKLYYSPKGWAHPPTAVVSRNRDWKFVPWKAKANFSDWEPGDWDIVPESQVFGGMR